MKIFNPRPLIESLRLNSGEQQDAQESVTGVYYDLN